MMKGRKKLKSMKNPCHNVQKHIYKIPRHSTMPVCCTCCCCCCLSRLNGWINWQPSSVGWGCKGRGKWRLQRRQHLTAKLPAFISSVSSRLISKLTDRQIDRRTHIHPAPQSATQLNVEAPERHYLLTFTDCLGFLFFSLSLTHIFTLSFLSLLFAIAEQQKQRQNLLFFSLSYIYFIFASCRRRPVDV